MPSPPQLCVGSHQGLVLPLQPGFAVLLVPVQRPTLGGHGPAPAPTGGIGSSGHLQLDLSVHLSILLGLLVALLQVLHQHCHHHVDQDELGDEDEGDEVDGGDDGQVTEAVLVLPSAFPECVLQQGGTGQGLVGLCLRAKTPKEHKAGTAEMGKRKCGDQELHHLQRGECVA